MSDRTAEEAVDTPAPETPKPAGRRKILVIAAGAVVLLLVTGGVLYMTGFADKFIGHKAPDKVAEAPPPPPAVFFDLPDLLVNLNTTGRKASFLKLSVSLELEHAEDLPKIQAVMPRVIDAFQVYLRELRIEDLRGSGGSYRLKEELLARVNTAAAPVKVAHVLFREMLVQ